MKRLLLFFPCLMLALSLLNCSGGTTGSSISTSTSAGTGTSTSSSISLSASRRNDLLSYLQGLPSRTSNKVISGQEAGDALPVLNRFSAQSGYASYLTALRTATGKLPALAGAGYGTLNPPIPTMEELLALNSVMKEHWNAGGIVTIGYAPHNPFTGGAANDNNLNGHSLSEVITPGTAANLYYLRELDNVAAALADMKAAGVPILFRPLPELNGNWFWWGAAANGRDFINLWTHMHDYLVGTKGLDNLIWVWAASRESCPFISPISKYWPGGTYVDVAGIDIYNDTLDQAAVNAYNEISAYGKPFALCEFGPNTNTTATIGTLDYATLISQIKTLMPNVVYFMAWADYIGTAGNRYWSMVSNRNAGILLADPWVVTADEVPPLGR